MVGHRFVEALRARDTDGAWRVTILAEESDAAYDRVGLTGYTEHWDRSRLALAGQRLCRRRPRRGRAAATARPGSIAPAKYVTTMLGRHVPYDALVLATGSYAFVPPVPGRDLPGCHVYRTLDDLDAIRADATARDSRPKTPVGVVIGGGLLGLEAANALRGFGLTTHVVEFSPRLMAAQLDVAGGALLTG